MLKSTDVDPAKVAAKVKTLKQRQAEQANDELSLAATLELQAEAQAEQVRQRAAQAVLNLDDMIAERTEALDALTAHLSSIVALGEQLRPLFAKMRYEATLARRGDLVVRSVEPFGLKKAEQNLRRSALAMLGSKL